MNCSSMHSRNMEISIFFFRLFPLGVATAESPSPFCSLLRVFFRHFHCCHVLSHRIHKPPFRSSPFPLSWQLHPQHPSPNIPGSIFPQYIRPNHLGLASRTFSPNRPTCAVPLMYSFRILSTGLCCCNPGHLPHML